MAFQRIVEDEFSLEYERIVSELVRFSPAVFNRRRLAILFELYSTPAVDYNQLRHDTGLKDGVLATHLRTLILTKFIEVKREDAPGSRSKTRYAITSRGREKVLELVALLGKINDRVTKWNLR